MEFALKTIAYYSVLLPVLVGGIRWRSLSRRQWLLLAFCAIAFLLQLLGEWMELKWGTNLPLYHFYIVLEFGCLLVPYMLEWRGKPLGKLLLVTGIAFVVIAIASASYYPGGMHFPVLTQTLSSVLLITVAVVYWARAFIEMKHLQIGRIYMFWLNAAILTYFTGNLLQSIFNEWIVTNARIFSAVWTIHHAFTLLFYILLNIGLLWKDPKTSSLASFSSAQ